ncbi:hypothetical protein J5N97_002033 [Dioscorea zingiberensis]|uniref:DUS-like FMN-binding domain-containing protein n=1 Tax=Dioscorea zingiberensis TaxID=325984 RepID=A0A9D5BSQ9_9LILI|nr:hypothetical protein J5N97_002033 [Dioscorea zingiberensis]
MWYSSSSLFALEDIVAPMMEWPDVHYRTLARLISKHVWLYSEMLAAETIVYQKDNLVSVSTRIPLASLK